MVYINGCLIFLTAFMLVYTYTVLYNMVKGLYIRIDDLENNLKATSHKDLIDDQRD